MSTNSNTAQPTTVPVGTRIVLVEDVVTRDGQVAREGLVGRVDAVDHPAYVMSTPTGQTLDVIRSQFEVDNVAVARSLTRRQADWTRLHEHIVLDVVVGSQAWNLAGHDSDVDKRGAFLLPWTDTVSLFRPPDEITDELDQNQYWEVEKLIRQALRADANTLETLWAPDVVAATEVGELLRARRDIFVSKRIYRSFGRYALSQLDKIRRKLEQAETAAELEEILRQSDDLRFDRVVGEVADKLGVDRADAHERIKRLTRSHFDQGLVASCELDALVGYLRQPGDRGPARRYRPKNAYNLIRLLESGIQWLSTGRPLIGIDSGRPDRLRERLLAIKGGEVPIEEVVSDAAELATRLEDAWECSALPDEPDFRAADTLLVECRRRATARAVRVVLSPPSDETPLRKRREAVLTRRERFALPKPALHAFLGRYDHLDPVFVSVVGAHNFGFPSADSDVDICGIHLAPATEFLGLDEPPGTESFLDFVDGLELDYTSHEAKKAIGLLLGGAGNMLERIVSPYQILPIAGEDPRHDERLAWLRELTVRCVNKRFHRHYLGFFGGIRREFQREPTTKRLLYMYRVALTGLRLMETGEILPDLEMLLDARPSDLARELVAHKRSGEEKGGVDWLGPSGVAAVEEELGKLEQLLKDSIEESHLPDEPPNRADFDGWLRFWRGTTLEGSRRPATR